MKLAILLFSVLGSVPILSVVGQCQTATWKDIRTMKSTRADVRRILKQSDQGRDFEIYGIKNGTIDVSYSYGKCTDEYNSGWNVVEDVVIELEFTPLTKLKFSKLNADLTHFQTIRESPDVPDLITYINRDKGLKYVVDTSVGLLNSIGFFPSSRYENLRCGSK